METEHLGNADAYRVSRFAKLEIGQKSHVQVTREIPLPYRRIEHDSDEDDKSPSSHSLVRQITRTKPQKQNSLSVHLDRIRRELVGGHDTGRGVDSENVGPRGHMRQREYEARRPGDGEEHVGQV